MKMQIIFVDCTCLKSKREVVMKSDDKKWFPVGWLCKSCGIRKKIDIQEAFDNL